MFKIFFIDNCNKLRTKVVTDLTSVNFEVYNFILLVVDDVGNVLNPKYLLLTELERAFYDKLSIVGSSFLMDNIVLQPVVRGVLNGAYLNYQNSGNTKIKMFAFYDLPIESGSHSFSNTYVIGEDSTGLILNKGFRYIDMDFALSNTGYEFETNNIKVRCNFGNVRLLDELLSGCPYRVGGFLNTDDFGLVVTIWGSYKCTTAGTKYKLAINYGLF